MNTDFIKGVVVPILTPIDGEERIDEARLRDQVDYVIKGGVSGILAFGSNGEFYMVEEDQAKLINETKTKGGRIIAVGTTSCRTLESATGEDGILKAGSGWTEIFIYPGYQFKLIDCLITNFHLPESTLMMLVSALAGRDKIMAAYKEAVEMKYRFFSFGDAMFIK